MRYWSKVWTICRNRTIIIVQFLELKERKESIFRIMWVEVSLFVLLTIHRISRSRKWLRWESRCEEPSPWREFRSFLQRRLCQSLSRYTWTSLRNLVDLPRNEIRLSYILPEQNPSLLCPRWTSLIRSSPSHLAGSSARGLGDSEKSIVSVPVQQIWRLKRIPASSTLKFSQSTRKPLALG